MKKQGWARNALESYCHEMNDCIGDASEEVEKQINLLVQKGFNFLERNPDAYSEEIDAMRVELETSFHAILNVKFEDRDAELTMSEKSESEP